MPEPIRIYYRPLIILRDFVVLGVILAVLWRYEALPTTYLAALKEPPGLWAVYGLWAVIAGVMLMRLPRLWFVMLRIPVVEFDGEILVLRSLRTHRLNVAVCDISYSTPRADGPIIVYASGAQVARIPSSRIDGPRTLIRLLGDLARPSA